MNIVSLCIFRGRASYWSGDCGRRGHSGGAASSGTPRRLISSAVNSSTISLAWAPSVCGRSIRTTSPLASDTVSRAMVVSVYSIDRADHC
jgi:hypothetical protein